MSDFIEDALVLKSTKKPTSGSGFVYNIQVNTPDNGDEWFGCGFTDPEVNEGDEIEFDIEQVGDYTNVIIDTIVVTKAAPKRERSSRSSGRSSSGSGRSSGRSSGGGRSSGRSSSSGRPSSGRSGGSSRSPKTEGRGRAPAEEKKPAVDWDKKDKYIRLQSSQNTAIATIRGGIEAGAIALPAKKGEKFDAYTALIEEEAARLMCKYTDIVNDCYEANEEGEYNEDDVPD